MPYFKKVVKSAPVVHNFTDVLTEQMSNLKFTNKIIQITKDEGIEKLGIFDLSQFLTALNLIDSTTIDINVNENVLEIKADLFIEREVIFLALTLPIIFASTNSFCPQNFL